MPGVNVGGGQFEWASTPTGFDPSPVEAFPTFAVGAGGQNAQIGNPKDQISITKEFYTWYYSNPAMAKYNTFPRYVDLEGATIFAEKALRNNGAKAGPIVLLKAIGVMKVPKPVFKEAEPQDAGQSQNT